MRYEGRRRGKQARAIKELRLRRCSDTKVILFKLQIVVRMGGGVGRWDWGGNGNGRGFKVGIWVWVWCRFHLKIGELGSQKIGAG
jgi:hypothetical protein